MGSSSAAPLATTFAIAGIMVGALTATAHAVPEHVDQDAKASEMPGGGAIQTELTVGGGAPGGEATGQGEGSGNPGGDPGPGPSHSGSTELSEGMMQVFWEPASGSPSCTLPWGGTGVVHERIEHDAQNGVGFVTGFECRDPADTPDAPAPPPPLPTVTEITDLARAQIEPPGIGLSPEPRSITGVDTRFWYEGAREATVSSSIRGYQITATARPTRFYWDPGDGSELLSSTRPGTKDNWAAEHVYRTKDYYTVTAQAVWEGDWSLTGHGASASGQLATIRTSSTREYQVNEFRGELRDTR